VVFAVDGVVWVAGAAAVVVAGGIALLVAPWGAASDRPLDHEAEARLLLGEDPDDIDEELRRRAETDRPSGEDDR
jgi:hypothetical protein